MAAFVAPLVGRGFSVVAFDAPGHGVSDEGLVTLPEMTAAVRAVAAAHPPVRGIIAHSIGVTAVARAVREGLAVDAAVFLAGPADLVTPALQVATALGLSPRVLDSMQRRIERRVGMPWSAFDVTRLAPAEPFPMLVVHDRGDGEVPWQHGRRIAQAWPGAELLETDGLGHRRILRDPRVVAAATVFLGAHAAARRREDAPIPVRSWEEASAAPPRPTPHLSGWAGGPAGKPALGVEH
jgi:pimeloyl-ACP methyl ester carboxylesterase